MWTIGTFSLNFYPYVNVTKTKPGCHKNVTMVKTKMVLTFKPYQAKRGKPYAITSIKGTLDQQKKPVFIILLYIFCNSQSVNLCMKVIEG